MSSTLMTWIIWSIIAWSVVLLFIIHTRLTLPDKETLQDTARVITSKPVQRAVVNTVLLVSTAATLFCTAAIASLLFFQNFLPHEVVTLPLHLQYGWVYDAVYVAMLLAWLIEWLQLWHQPVWNRLPSNAANEDAAGVRCVVNFSDASLESKRGAR